MKVKNILNKYRRPLVALVHLLLIVGAYVMAFYLRFDFKIESSNLAILYKTLPILIIVKMAVFGYYGLFQAFGVMQASKTYGE